MFNIQRSGMNPVGGSMVRDEKNPITQLKNGDFNKIIAAQMSQQSSISANQLNKYNQQLAAYNQHWAYLTGNAPSQSGLYAQNYTAPAYNYSAYTPAATTSYVDQPNALLGKTVTANAQAYDSNGAATTTQVSGVVQGVYIENGQTYLSVNGYKVNPSDVLSVDGAAASSAAATTASSASTVAADTSLIGKTVSVTYTDASGNEQYMEGVVTNVRTVIGKQLATINGIDIDVNNIHAVLSGNGTNGVNGTYGMNPSYNMINQTYNPFAILKTPQSNPNALPPHPDIAGIEIGTGTVRPPMPDTIARTASYGGNFANSTYGTGGMNSAYGAGSASYYNNSMEQMIQWILADPGLVTDGEFEIFGTPDENGAYG